MINLVLTLVILKLLKELNDLTTTKNKLFKPATKFLISIKLF